MTLSFCSFSLMCCRIVWVYLAVGLWVYPLLGHFSTTGLVGFFFFNMSVVILLYVLGDKLNAHFWSKQQAKHLKQRKDHLFTCKYLSLTVYIYFVSFREGLEQKEPKLIHPRCHIKMVKQLLKTRLREKLTCSFSSKVDSYSIQHTMKFNLTHSGS